MTKLLKRAGLGLAGLLLLQAAARLYLFFRPHITPPAVHGLLESRWRRRYRDPARTLAPLQARPGQTLLEIGGGTGLFSGAAVQQVVPGGRVISIDRQRPMLERLRRRTAGLPPDALHLHLADARALPLRDRSVDAAFMIAVLPMIPDRVGALREVRRVLKPGGCLLVSEELMAPEYVPPAITLRWARRAGFALHRRQPGFWSYSLLLQPSPDVD
ncbi:class I SAM-dependent methyltransferase [Kallotenue papyrolyticum]|uniref:class I SAM-dependent methyltransferase n=1 Tax=Kallotenue papyrolyticum TaxID=1325125 RepID=UPI0004786131|nr:methyltransferase domain-containing protein [Kallotenue papyrolyticum]